MIPDAVVKVGGSLCGGPHLRPLLATLGAQASAGRTLVVVPGGGPFADAVRLACTHHDPGEAHAHWMAVCAMEQFAHLLAGLAPGARLVHDPAGIAALPPGRLAILAPLAWLRSADPLPHSWEVTSDSIAAWVAARLGAPCLILLKTVDGVRDGKGETVAELPRAELCGVGEVDPFFTRSLEPTVRCWIINGRHPERVRELLERGWTRGTRVR